MEKVTVVSLKLNLHTSHVDCDENAEHFSRSSDVGAGLLSHPGGIKQYSVQQRFVKSLLKGSGSFSIISPRQSFTPHISYLLPGFHVSQWVPPKQFVAGHVHVHVGSSPVGYPVVIRFVSLLGTSPTTATYYHIFPSGPVLHGTSIFCSQWGPSNWPIHSQRQSGCVPLGIPPF